MKNPKTMMMMTITIINQIVPECWEGCEKYDHRYTYYTEEAGHAGLDSTRDTEDDVSTAICHDA